jgi:hypothetical protein
MGGKWVSLAAVVAAGTLLGAPAALAATNSGLGKLDAIHASKAKAGSGEGGMVTKNFGVLGHHDLGMTDVNGDV